MPSNFTFFNSDLNSAFIEYCAACNDPIAKDIAIHYPEKIKDAISEFWVELDNYVFKSMTRVIIQEVKVTHRAPDFSEEAFLDRVNMLQEDFFTLQGISSGIPKLPGSVVKYLIRGFVGWYPANFDTNKYLSIIEDEEEPVSNKCSSGSFIDPMGLFRD